MLKNQEQRDLDQAQVATLLSEIYSGPFLIPRAVTLEREEGGALTATSQVTFEESHPFFQWHKHAFPGVILLEFTQQLGFIIAKEELELKGHPFMFKIENTQIHSPVQPGNTVIARTRLGERKRHFLFFDGEIRRDNGDLVLTSHFCGAGK